MKKSLILAGILLLGPLAFAAWGDTITLRNGTRYEGTFLGATSSTVTFRDRDGVGHSFSINDVQTIDFYSSDDSTYNRNQSRSEQSREITVLPASTEIQVRTNETIESKDTAEGRTYSAQIEKDVINSSGNVVIPKGSDAHLVIQTVSSGGGLGSPEIALDLDSVTVEGRRYVVSTSDLEERNSRGIGKNKRTGEMVGGGAALGTLLGAIAGGSEGAVIGAVSGAAVGATVQVLTKGKEVRVPAETVLTFRLDKELRLQPER